MLNRYAKPFAAALVFLASTFLVSWGIMAGAKLLGVSDIAFMWAVASILSGIVSVLILSFMGMVARKDLCKLPVFPFPHSVGLLFFSFLMLLSLNILSETLELPDINASHVKLLLGSPWGVCSIALFSPIVEELVFREAMIGGMLRDGIKPMIAIALSSLLFGIVHFNPAQIPFAILAGLLMGVLYYKSHSLLLVILLHILNNGTAVLLSFVYGEDATLQSLLGGLSQCLMVAFLLLVIGLWGLKSLMSSGR